MLSECNALDDAAVEAKGWPRLQFAPRKWWVFVGGEKPYDHCSSSDGMHVAVYGMLVMKVIYWEA